MLEKYISIPVMAVVAQIMVIRALVYVCASELVCIDMYIFFHTSPLFYSTAFSHMPQGPCTMHRIRVAAWWNALWTRVKITGHQTPVVILSSIREECKLLKPLSNQLKLILACSPLILWLKLRPEGVSLGDNSYEVVSHVHILGCCGILNTLCKWQIFKMEII